MAKYNKITPRFWLLSIALWASSVAVQSQTFENSWQRVLEFDDHLAAERANVDSQSALSEATDDINLPRLDLNGAYIQMAD
ncbi:MAG: hypothetical protein HWD83_09205, partial [Gammaproteobacteria bacterium]|nr:hypothetical protein [Gammaproteobacteria bacterium]